MQILSATVTEESINCTNALQNETFIDELRNGLVIPKTREEKFIVYCLYMSSGYLNENHDIKFDYLRTLAAENEEILKYYAKCEKQQVIEDKVENLHNFVECVVRNYQNNVV